MLDPRFLSSKFTIVDSKLKARYGTQPFVFGDKQWSNISAWIENDLKFSDRVLETDVLVARMMHADCDIRAKNQRIWMGIVLCAARSDQMVVFSHKGEFEQSKSPKLRARTYKQGISLYDLTKIILDHREELVRWSQAKAQIAPVVVPVVGQSSRPSWHQSSRRPSRCWTTGKISTRKQKKIGGGGHLFF